MDRKLLLIVILAIFLSYMLITSGRGPEKNIEINPLDGCTYVYLDMGSNRGIQIRKLFEPTYFPAAGVLNIFDKYFGKFEDRNPREVCAVGWEPNPTHTDLLRGLETAYNKCGWKVVLNTATGVGARKQIKKFASMDTFGDLTYEPIKTIQVAGALVNEQALDVDEDVKNSKVLADVSVVRIAEYVKEVVGKRLIPHSKKGAVVMKLDVEGNEMEIISDLIHGGALPYLDNVHIDWPSWTKDDQGRFIKDTKHEQFRLALNTLQDLISANVNLTTFTELSPVDDESYSEFGGSLPQC